MAKPLAVGDKVSCRLYNTPDGKFYGESWASEILEIVWALAGNKLYLVNKDGHPKGTWLKHKEILRRIK